MQRNSSIGSLFFSLAVAASLQFATAASADPLVYDALEELSTFSSTGSYRVRVKVAGVYDSGVGQIPFNAENTRLFTGTVGSLAGPCSNLGTPEGLWDCSDNHAELDWGQPAWAPTGATAGPFEIFRDASDPFAPGTTTIFTIPVVGGSLTFTANPNPIAARVTQVVPETVNFDPTGTPASGPWLATGTATLKYELFMATTVDVSFAGVDLVDTHTDSRVISGQEAGAPVVYELARGEEPGQMSILRANYGPFATPTQSYPTTTYPVPGCEEPHAFLPYCVVDVTSVEIDIESATFSNISGVFEFEDTTVPIPNQPQCNDIADNDGDTGSDFPLDVGCFAFDSPLETPQCANGLDDDGDGFIDHPDDPGCDFPWQDDESVPAAPLVDLRVHHFGALNPELEGWTRSITGTPTDGPVYYDGNTRAEAWEVVALTSNTNLAYRTLLSADEMDRASSEGWTLSVEMSMPRTPEALDLSITAYYSNTTTRWLMSFGSTAAGDPIVDLSTGPAVPALTGLGPGYHTYELVWEPNSAVARLLVDGVDQGVSYTGAPIGSALVAFGDGQNGSTGHSRWRRVDWQIDVPECADGEDNDGDGLTDAADPACLAGAASESPCNDGRDNDFDGTFDFPDDLGCSSAADDSERDPLAVCDDGIDNDGDGLADFPLDPGCRSLADDDEFSSQSVVLAHYSDRDPITEGWALAATGPYQFNQKARPLNDSPAPPAWSIEDFTTASDRWSYSTTLIGLEKAQADEWGYALRAFVDVAAVAGVGDPVGSIGLRTLSGTSGYELLLGESAAGELLIGAGCQAPGDGYHLVELRVDPMAPGAEGVLFVDGVEVCDAPVNAAITDLAFGSIASGDGHGLFHLVQMALVDPPAGCDDGANDDGDADGLFDSTELTTYETDPCNPDTDGDSLLDGFETDAGFDPLVAGETNLDPDADGLDNLAEQNASTDPNDADSDDDGLNDFAEVVTHGTDPNNPDTDGDGLTDDYEVAQGFDPLVPNATEDPDADGLDNLAELAAGTDPNDADSDDDGLSDFAEVVIYGTNPLVQDTDGDGLRDDFEVAFGFDPLTGGEQSQDPDADGLDNLAEQAAGTNPNDADTDADDLTDFAELMTHGTDPLNADTDGDLLFDGFEFIHGFDPLIAGETYQDPDVDGLDNLAEQTAGTDPNDEDTDDDGLNDFVETATGVFVSTTDTGTNPLDPDTDGDELLDDFEVANGFDPNTSDDRLLDPDLDGLTNLGEQAAATNPNIADSDLDGLNDGDERLRIQTMPLTPTQIVSKSYNAPLALDAGDMDDDGDVDVVAASFLAGSFVWFENLDGAGSFASPQTIASASNINRVRVADVDGNGIPDVIGAFGNTLAWYENSPPLGSFGGAAIPIATTTGTASSIQAADLDGDGNLDVVAATAVGDSITWYPNTGGGFGPGQLITASADSVASIYVVDVDGDGDVDVLSASGSDDKIAWYENIDGLGTFVTHVITTVADSANSVHAGDLNGDGYVDVLSSAFNDNELAWYANDGIGGFGPGQSIATLSSAKGVEAVDVDGDGDLDVVGRSSSAFNWYENTDGLGSFVLHGVGGIADSAHLARDLDGDSDIDLVGASSGDDEILWKRNPGTDPLDPDSDADGLLDGTEVAAGFDPNVAFIVNGDAETGDTSGWTSAIDTMYTKTGGACPSPVGGRCFVGLSGGTNKVLRQVIDVSTLAAAIDAGAVQSSFAGWGQSGNGGGLPDEAQLVIEFRVVGGGPIESFHSGVLGDPNFWQFAQDNRTIPAGTREIWVEMIMTRPSGGSTDAYLDGVSLTLALPECADGIDNDGDGLIDHAEDPTCTGLTGTAEFLDSDGDGLEDGFETNTGIYVSPTDTGTDPTNPDTDGDGFNDDVEVLAGSDPNDPQSTPNPVQVPSLAPVSLVMLVALLLATPAWLRRARRPR